MGSESLSIRRVDPSIAVEGQASFSEFLGRSDSWRDRVAQPGRAEHLLAVRTRVHQHMAEIGIPPADERRPLYQQLATGLGRFLLKRR